MKVEKKKDKRTDMRRQAKARGSSSIERNDKGLLGICPTWNFSSLSRPANGFKERSFASLVRRCRWPPFCLYLTFDLHAD